MRLVEQIITDGNIANYYLKSWFLYNDHCKMDVMTEIKGGKKIAYSLRWDTGILEFACAPPAGSVINVLHQDENEKSKWDLVCEELDEVMAAAESFNQ